MEELTRNQADAKKLEFGQIKQGIKNLEKASGIVTGKQIGRAHV